MLPKPWKIISSKKDDRYQIFTLRTDRACSPRTGEEHDFFIVESPPWVNVIPLTSDNDVILIHQYRHGTKELTLEIPGGILEPGDTPLDAAARELREETGYKGEDFICLGSVHPNPAIQNNLCYTFLAKNVCPVWEQELDDQEDIEVVLYPLSEIVSLIREGVITHSLVIAAFYRFFMEYSNYSGE